MKRPDPRRSALIGGLFVLATSVVIASVWTPAPHSGGDNAGYLALAYSLVEGRGYTELWAPGTPPHAKYPPGFPILLGGLILVGATSWAAFKLLSAVTVSFALLLVFAWASERRGPVAGGAVALLTLLSAGWMEASRWILSEPTFLAWTFLGLWAAERSSRGTDRNWTVLAGLAAVGAFFTRSAGLPLVLAFLGTLLLARRFRAAGSFALVFALPTSLWLLRVRRGGGEGAYASEFWMVNPYEPDLGTIGWLDLPARAWENALLYVEGVLPGEWWGEVGGGALPLLGVALVSLAAWGWTLRCRREAPGTAELFLPLYLGLVLLWPPVWSGDRFILPLYPILLLYAGEAARTAGLPLGRSGGRAMTVAAFLILAVPALAGWKAIAAQAAACRNVAEAGDVFACHGDAFREFRDAAAWSGANLPEDAVVLNRKPRIHFLLGGPPGLTFPLTHDADRFLEEADRVGARFLLLDHVDGVALYYLPVVLQARLSAFCQVVAWGGTRGFPGTLLFGILPAEEREMRAEADELVPCPASYRAEDPRDAPTEGARIPLLVSR